MLRWSFGLFICLFGSALQAAEPATKNVILFVIDDLGRNDLGCYGSKYYRTPNLDAFAKTGLQFQDFYAACPVCSPTRASIMTGKYPARLNLTDWLPGRGDLPAQKLKRPEIARQLPLEEVTIAEALRQKGYVTGHIGKWHLGGQGYSPTEQGFQVNIAGDHTGTPASYFAHSRTLRGNSCPVFRMPRRANIFPIALLWRRRNSSKPTRKSPSSFICLITQCTHLCGQSRK